MNKNILNQLIKTLKNMAKCNAFGNPFSACIYNPKTKQAFLGVNRVKISKDQTAHAEMTVLREYAQIHGKIPKNCIMIASGSPCPMCLTAIAWTGLKKVYYIYSHKIALKKGFKFDRESELVNKYLKLGLQIKKI